MGVLYIYYIFNIFKKYCFDADPDLAQNLDADPDPDRGGGRGGKIVHPPWQNPRYAPGSLESCHLIFWLL